VSAEQGGNTAVLRPGDLVLIDPVRPVRFVTTATTTVTMLVPKRLLRLGPDAAGRLAGVRIRGDRGPGALVSSLARGMARSLAGFRADEADRSAAAVIELIAVALSAQLDDPRSGDAAAFLADFADDAELMDFEGTVHKGREKMIAFHQPVFDTVKKGSRLLRGEVVFAALQNSRLISLETAMALESLAVAE
jgi:uncharacterized protein (TIGR02246 family)